MDEILAFVRHKYDCDFVQPMWHQGPCDCGLHALFDKLKTTSHYRLTLDDVRRANPDLIKAWEEANIRKAEYEQRKREADSGSNQT